MKTTQYQIGDIVRCTLPAKNSAGTKVMGERNALIMGAAMNDANGSVLGFYVLRFSRQFHKRHHQSDIVLSTDKQLDMGITAFHTAVILRTDIIDIVRPEEVLNLRDQVQDTYLFDRVRDMFTLNGVKLRQDERRVYTPKGTYAQSSDVLAPSTLPSHDFGALIHASALVANDPYTMALQQQQAQVWQSIKNRGLATPMVKI